MPLRRRVSKDIMDRYAADEELAGTYRDRLAAVAEAESELRTARTLAAESGLGNTNAAGLHASAVELDKALTAALLAAEAAERVEEGPKTYAPGDTQGDIKAGIARRQAKAKPAVRPWTDEVDRLRTAREAHRFSFRTAPNVAASI